MQTTLHNQDDNFKAIGAVSFHDSMYPYQPRTGYAEPRHRELFSRHYFNEEGTEIGLVIPDLFEVGMGVQVFDTPRVWGIPHDKNPL